MPEQPRTPLALAALATLARPGLDVVATRPPRDPGADFDVVGIVDAEDRRWIVRSPRHDAAGAAMEGEVALLEGLADAVDDGRLPFDVPRPAGFAPLPEGGRAMLYPELVGRPLQPARLSPRSPLLASVVEAIAALHALPGAVVRDAGLPDYDAEGYRLRRLAELDAAARTGHLPAALLRRWEHALEDVHLWRFAATPVHGDLAAEHVLTDGGRVVGIVDWSDARVADPADDLAWLLSHTPPESAEAVLVQYGHARGDAVEGSLEALDARATLAGELAVARWLMHGVRIRSDEVIEDAIDMLRDLDAALADAPPIGRVEPPVEPFVPDEHEEDEESGDDKWSEEADAVDDESSDDDSGVDERSEETTSGRSGVVPADGVRMPDPDDAPTAELPLELREPEDERLLASPQGVPPVVEPDPDGDGSDDEDGTDGDGSDEPESTVDDADATSEIAVVPTPRRPSPLGGSDDRTTEIPLRD